jgi:aspartate kinase
MVVYKFGGTSVGTPERIKEISKLINTDENKIVVLSAMSGTTNKLVEISSLLYGKENLKAIEEITALQNYYIEVVEDLFFESHFKNKGKELILSHFNYINSFTEDLFTVHEEKAVLAQGELLSTALLHFYLEEQNIDSCLISALDFMRVDKDGEPDEFYIKENLLREIEKTSSKIIITQGFICRNSFGEVDNLKRGGSDYSASLIGVAAAVSEVQIWTDIDGIHNNDPRFVEGTKSIDYLSYDEAAELAYFGAKILHPASIQPSKKSNIPVRLKNTMSPLASGTLIGSEIKGNGIKSIAAKDNITVIKIKSGRMLLAYGFMRKIFEIFEIYKTSIDMIVTSEVAVSITIDDNTYLKNITEELNNLGVVEVDEQMSIVCIVGNFIDESKGHALEIFKALKNVPIRMISYGGSRHNVSLLVNTSDKKEALNLLNQNLFADVY